MGCLPSSQLPGQVVTAPDLPSESTLPNLSSPSDWVFPDDYLDEDGFDAFDESESELADGTPGRFSSY